MKETVWGRDTCYEYTIEVFTPWEGAGMRWRYTETWRVKQGDKVINDPVHISSGAFYGETAAAEALVAAKDDIKARFANRR